MTTWTVACYASPVAPAVLSEHPHSSTCVTIVTRAMTTASAAPSDAAPLIRVGVLALQGSFREHMASLNRVPGVQAIEVRTKEELASVAGLIIPGGESTTMALVAERWGLIPELRAFAKTGKPIWGTCAGMIFLAERASGRAMTTLTHTPQPILLTCHA